MTDTAGAAKLGDLFQPRNVALVGATDRSTWSAMIHTRFAMWGHRGELFAVNRDGRPAHGMPGYRSCTEIPEPVDLAYLYVPASGMSDAIRDAAKAGIRNAIILTSGFAEAGPEGLALQEDVKAVAAEAGMRLLGPNSVGFINLAAGAVATSIAPRDPILPGRLACVAQSGAIVSDLYYCADHQGFGIGFFAATGNEVATTAIDIADHLIDDPAIGAILMYIESFVDPGRFAAVAERALRAAKPIVIIKLGRSPIARELAMAHTGSDIGDEQAFEEICERYGVCRVASIEELVATGALLERIGPIDPPQISMVSISGGACAIYADLAHQHGLETIAFSDETRAALREVLPSFAGTLNPLDVTGVVMNVPDLWSRIIPIMARDPNFGLTVTAYPMPLTENETALMASGFEAIAEGYRTANAKSAIVSLAMQGRSPSVDRLIERSGVDVVIPGLDLGVRALAHLQNWSRAIKAIG